MAARHRSDILEPIARPHACAIGDALILMQDNARALCYSAAEYSCPEWTRSTHAHLGLPHCHDLH